MIGVTYPRKILITGAGGYIGSVLSEFLTMFHVPLVLVDVAPITPKDSSVTAIQRDISDLAIPDDVDAVVHLAAVVGTKACAENPEEAKRTNLTETARLLDKCKNKRFIFVNTNCGLPPGFSDETAELSPTGVYAETKKEAEKLVLAAGGVSLRLASVYGVSPKMRDDLLLNFLVKEAVTKKEIQLFEGDVQRNFVHVNDVSYLIGRFIEAQDVRGVFNVAIEEHKTKREIAHMIKRVLPDTKIVEVEGKDPDGRNYVVSTKKLRDYGFVLTHSYEDGIKELVRYYESRKV